MDGSKRHTVYIRISVSVAVKCWLERKIVFVDIMENCLEYERVLKLLNYHQAHIETFLSKNVTHIITGEKTYQKSETILKKMQSSRAKKMVQLAVQARPQKVSSKPEKPVLTLNDLMKFSVNCNKHVGNRNRSLNEKVESFTNNIVAKVDQRMNAHVRELQGKYIKVEDVSGKYRPLVVEMKDWPELQLDCDNTPFTHPKVLKSIPIHSRIQKKLCELCNHYYTCETSHLNGSEHQKNAHNNTLFASLDDVIQKGPTLRDLLKNI